MRGELMQRTVTRQVRYCTGPVAPRRPAPVFGRQQAAEHPSRTAFLCVFHVRSHPGCSQHEVQILGDWYGADEVACGICLEEAA
jgi:hypothetical protein